MFSGGGFRVEKTPLEMLFRDGCLVQRGAGWGVWTGTDQFVWVGTNENKWSDRVKRLRSRLKDPLPLSISNSGRLMRAGNSHFSVSFTPWGLGASWQWCVQPTCWPVMAQWCRARGDQSWLGAGTAHSTYGSKKCHQESCVHFYFSH